MPDPKKQLIRQISVIYLIYLCHMFVRVKSYPNNKRAIQIVENCREKGLVKQRIIRHIGRAETDKEVERMKELAEYIRAEMECAATPTIFSSEELAKIVIESRRKSEEDQDLLQVSLKKLREEHRIITGIHDVYGKLYDQTGFNTLLKSCRVSKKVLKDVTMARIAKPCSKRASVDMLKHDFGITYSLDSVYRMMDHFNDEIIRKLQQLTFEQTRSLYDHDINVLFYDCTTLYFESFTEDELKQLGYSKDHKFNQSQVLLALLVTTDGLPVGYEVFNGSMFEGHTLETILQKVKTQYKISRAIFVADSGLLSRENTDKLQDAGIEYIVGARLKSLTKKWQNKILDNKKYLKQKTDDDLLRYSSFVYDNHRTLVVSHSQKREEKDRYDRERAIEKLRTRLEKNKDMKNLISNYGYKKFIKATGKSSVEVDLIKVEKESEWDGLHGVFTNIKNVMPEKILSHYHGLWQIEECFRISKHDLKMRPVFHWTPDRIRVHIAICYMAFSLIRYLQQKLRKEYQPLSPEIIQNELAHVQVSILKHIHTNDMYVIPSKPGKHTEHIYNLLGMKYSRVPFRLYSIFNV